MRKLVLFALLAATCGCQSGGGLFGSKSKPKDNQTFSDPLHSPDIDEQQKYGRSRYAYPEDDRRIAPDGFAGRGSPSGR